MKGFFWIAACGLAAVGGVAIQNGAQIGSVFSEIAEHDSVTIDVSDGGDFTVQRSSIDSSAADAAEDARAEAAAAIDSAVEALAQAQDRIAEIRADTELSDEERAEALSAAQAERDEALEQLRDTEAVSTDAGEQVASGVEQAIQGVITAIESSDAEIRRDGEVLTGEEREQAIAEIRQEVRDRIRDEIRSEVRN